MENFLFSSIAALIIGIATGIIGFISRYWVEALIRGKHHDYVSVLPGTWAGKVSQQKGVKGNNEIVFELKTFLKVVYGTIMYKGEEYTLKVVGGFVQDRYLSLHYENIDKATLQHGSLVLQLSGTKNDLSGYFLGVGPLSENIVHGSVQVQRQET
ncbi:hypothetical protein [Aliikangiella coralliicola]|uniref:Uncharacterized protein n=1 Tax=Aliikangiella coralliicola TaxID=2592383 RepID=A0A545U085_9GAMM|nr:hypothetical protein [Aliikangiella coralliicola]TQV82877.1 hypothetical protein FLL46_24210 [Aliikangiella coralliicola]